MGPLYLADLLGLLGHDGFTSVCHRPPGGEFSSSVVPSHEAPAVAALLSGDIWYGVNPVRGPARINAGRGTAADVIRLAAVYADLDLKPGGMPSPQAAAGVINDLADMLGTRPSATVLSGHGLQPYWPIELPCPTGADARALLRRWGRLVMHVAEIRGGKADMVYDVARVLRVPNTTNYKSDPVAVVGVPDQGRPLTVGELDEALDLYGAVEMAGDRDEPGAVVVSDPGAWAWADTTCQYASLMMTSWSSDTPSARHPWLVAQATRIWAAVRNGCLDRADHAEAVDRLVQQFRQLLNKGEVRREAPGEIADAFAWGRAAVSSMSSDHLASELGRHSHDHDEPLSFLRTGPVNAFSQPGSNWQQPGGIAPPGRRVRATRASGIVPEPVVWTWLGRVPRGEITLTPGRGGIGKSTFHAWLIAKLTLGTLPGAHYGTPRPCMVAATEDSWKRTIVPRLMAAGADLDLVYQIDVVTEEGEGVIISLPRDLVDLERNIVELGAALLSIDPLMGVVDGRLDTHKDRDVRQALTPLATLADRTQCTILGNAHFNKGSGSDPLALVMGSAGFGNVARAVLGFARDPDADEEGTCVISLVKNNLGRLDLPSLSYRIENVNLQTPKGVAEVGRLVMTGESARSVSEILAAANSVTGASSKTEVAAVWIKTFVQNKRLGYAPASEVLDAGQAAGFTVDVLKKARARAKLSTVKKGMEAGWYWCLPGVEPSDEDDTKVTTFPGYSSSSSSAPSNGFSNTESNYLYEDAEDAEGVVPRAREPLRKLCSTCDNPLLLIRPGRTQCERCRLGGVIEGQVS